MSREFYIDAENKIIFEQSPSQLSSATVKKTPWALISILSVLIFFTLYWVHQNNNAISLNDSFEAPVFVPSKKHEPQTENSPDDLSSLEAKIVNTAIPDYSQDF